jgi:hypothetical protein
MRTKAIEIEDEAPELEGLRHRKIPPEDWLRHEGNMAEIFQAMGMELETPGTASTPTRFLRAMFDASEVWDAQSPSSSMSNSRSALSSEKEGPVTICGRRDGCGPLLAHPRRTRRDCGEPQQRGQVEGRGSGIAPPGSGSGTADQARPMGAS